MTQTSGRRAHYGGGCSWILLSSFGMTIRGAGNRSYKQSLFHQLHVFLLLSELLATVSASKFRTCEPYLDAVGLYHPGFHCPRLNDDQKQTYCCRQSNQTLKYCCNKPEFQSTKGVNLTEATRSPVKYGLLAAVLVYGLGVIALLLTDLLYYYSLNRDDPRLCPAPASLCRRRGNNAEGRSPALGENLSSGQCAL
ncbi:protein shisa-like-1 isoform X1 [Hypanus sabinus]|uniref:protein shisa-like-1 isoform X1 n=2 Tax=Hypanus sabinus TaxID=79690 RepID=UPI0028C39E4D|nr:protein shisa-like-1 isoform X1 [Hypanus sabinus]